MKAKASIFAALGFVARADRRRPRRSGPTRSAAGLGVGPYGNAERDLARVEQRTKTLESGVARTTWPPTPCSTPLRGDVQKPITAEQRKRLNIGANEPVIYRRVILSAAIMSSRRPTIGMCRAVCSRRWKRRRKRATFPSAARSAWIRAARPLASIFCGARCRRAGKSVRRPTIRALAWRSAGFVRTSRDCVCADGQPVSEVEEHYTSAISISATASNRCGAWLSSPEPSCSSR